MAPRIGLIICVIGCVAGCATRRAAAPPAQVKARPPAPTAPAPAGPQVLVRVTDAATGRPLPGASIAMIDRDSSPLFPVYRPAGQTDPRGEFRLAVPDADAGTVAVRASAPGRVPTVTWARIEGLDAPAIQLSLPQAVRVGGTVSNEEGQPVEGAEVRLEVGEQASVGVAAPALDDVVARTGPDGRWSMDVFPPTAPQAMVMATHPDYVGPFTDVGDLGWFPAEQLRGGTVVTVLRRGVPLEGVVKDQDGKPIRGARVTLGFGAGLASDEGPTAGLTRTTGADGRYRFDHVGAAMTAVTVQADGHAPDFREVAAQAGMPPVEFKLAPGRRLNLRVVDRGGGPVPGAKVVAWQWRGRQSLRWSGTTGPDGRLLGADLPADPVTYSVSARGRMGVEAKLTAGEAEQVVELPPALRVHGAVVDAETGQPVPRVRVLSGINLGDGTGTRWDNPETSVAAGGHYARTFDAPMAGYQMRFEADGYLPETSRTFKSDEGDVALDVKLRRATTPTLTVVSPDDKPAADVEVVALGAGQTEAVVQDAKIDTMYGRPVPSKTDADGHVALELPAGDYVLLAIGDAGYVSVPSAQVPAGPERKLVLKPWARVTGQAFSGGKPVAGQVVSINSLRTLKSGAVNITASVSSHGVSGEQGRFEVKQCITGPATVGRMVTHAERNMSSEELVATVEVRPPPQATEITIGTGGRTVVAKVIPPDDFGPDWATRFECMGYLQPTVPPLPLPKNWLSMDEQQRREWTEQFKQTDAGREWVRQQGHAAAFNVVFLNRDGTLRAEDVRPGSYSLTVQTSEPRWARLVHEFTVPEPAAGKDEGAVDLGRLELLPRVWPKSGTTQPAEVR